MSETELTRTDTYPVASADYWRIPVQWKHTIERTRIRARWTGERRAPKQGEWYLSGAVIEAYYAPNAFPEGNKYHIAELVEAVPTFRVDRVLRC